MPEESESNEQSTCRHCGADGPHAFASDVSDWLCPECERYQNSVICPTCHGLADVRLMEPDAVPAKRSRKAKE